MPRKKTTKQTTQLDTPADGGIKVVRILRRGDAVRYRGRTGQVVDVRFHVDAFGNPHPDLLIEFTDFLRAWTGVATWREVEKIA